MPTPENTACPQCGQLGLTVAPAIIARPLGTWSLSGQQPKVSAHLALRWTCEHCGASGPAQATQARERPDEPTTA